MDRLPARPQTSTTGRLYLSTLRLAAGLLERLSPEGAARLAVEVFARPRRSRMPAAPPQVPGLTPRALRVFFEGALLHGWIFGAGPTVLLVHGWEGQAAQLSPLIGPLVARGLRVVVFDHLAHGQSPGRRSTLPLMARAVLTVGRAVGPLEAVVGHSLGGTASALALAWGLEAARCALLCPPLEVPPFARAVAAGLGLGEAGALRMLARLAREVGPLEALDLRRVAPRLRLPLLVLHDEADREVPFAHGEALAAAWPGARLLPLRGLGHRRLLRDPEVIRAVAEFVAPDALALSA